MRSRWKSLPSYLVVGLGLGAVAKRIGKGATRAYGRRHKVVRGLLRDYLPFLQARRRSRVGLIAAGVSGGLVGTAMGGVALLSRLGMDVPRLGSSLGADPRYFSWRGFRIAYYVKGQGEPLLLLHSIHAAASAFEMREPFDRLSLGYQVFALDLLGFGASDRPAIRYSADLYVDLLRDFVRGVIGAPAHVVASSLSGAFAAVVAAQEPGLARSLLLVDPTGLLTLARPQNLGGRLLEGLFRAPILGQAAFNVLVSQPSIRYFLGKAHAAKEKVDEAMVQQNYLTAHQAGARFAPAAFVGQGLNVNLERVLPALPARTLIVWTQSDYQDTAAERDAFARVNPRLQMRTIPTGGGLLFDEQPERFVALVREIAAPREQPAAAAAPH